MSEGRFRGVDPVALAIVALALLVRLPGIHLLGLHGDEDISTLVARGIVQHGVPLLPTGVPYLRSPIFHYAIAPLVATGVEWLPRLFSVVCSVLTVGAIMRFGREIVGRSGAVVAGLLLALSLTEIDVARTTRMYALYELVSVLVIVVIHRFWTTGAPRWGRTAVIAAGASMFAHQLGATLTVLIAPLVLIRDASRRSRVLLAGSAVLVAGLGGVYRLAASLTRYAGGERVTEPSVGGEAVRDTFRGLLADDPFGLGRRHDAFLLVIGITTVAGAAAVWVGSRGDRVRTARRVAATVTLAGVTGLAGAHQIGLAVAAWLLVLLVHEEVLPGRAGRTALLVSAFTVAAAGLAWTAAALGAPAGYTLADVVIGLVRWPGRLASLFVYPPAIALVAFAGAVAVLVRCWVGRATASERFLVFVIVALTTVRGIMAGKTESRYLTDVWPVVALLGGWAVASASAALAGRFRSRAVRRRVGVLAACAGGVLLLLLPGTSVRSIAAFLSLRPGEAPPRGTSLGRVADIAGAADVVLARRLPDDRIVATDWLTTYCVIGRVDGWIRWQAWAQQSTRRDGAVRDVYIGAEVLPDLPSLTRFVEHGRTWIVAGGGELAPGGIKLAPDVRTWLLSLEPVWTNAHDHTSVYFVDETTPRPGAASLP